MLGASFDIKQGYNASVSLQPFNMPFDGDDNNDSITVIDITDLDHVRYCFMMHFGANGQMGIGKSVSVTKSICLVSARTSHAHYHRFGRRHTYRLLYLHVQYSPSFSLLL